MECESKVQEKEEEFMLQLEKLRTNKQTSVETVTSQLEFAHQQVGVCVCVSVCVWE